MGQHTLNWVDFIGITDLLDLGSDILVKSSDSKSSSGSKESIVSGLNDIGLLSLGLSSDDYSVGSVGTESIEVSSELNLDKIFVLKGNAIIWAWWKVASYLVYTNASREADSSFELLWLLIAVSFSKFFFDKCINCSANGGDISSLNAKLNGFLKSS